MAAEPRQRAPSDACDLPVIDGGIDGGNIARDAAGRGLSVLLAERRAMGQRDARRHAKNQQPRGGAVGVRRRDRAPRRLAEHALETLRPFFPTLRGPWTGDAILPGGAVADADFDRFPAAFPAASPFLPAETDRHLARADGTRARDIVETARSLADLGEVFDGGLTAAEVDDLRAEAWAFAAEDTLWRRSKLGRRTGPARLAAYLDRRAAAA